MSVNFDRYCWWQPWAICLDFLVFVQSGMTVRRRNMPARHFLESVSVEFWAQAFPTILFGTGSNFLKMFSMLLIGVVIQSHIKDWLSMGFGCCFFRWLWLYSKTVSCNSLGLIFLPTEWENSDACLKTNFSVQRWF